MNDREIAVLRALDAVHAAGQATTSVSALARALGWTVDRADDVCERLWRRDLIAQTPRKPATTRLTAAGRQALATPEQDVPYPVKRRLDWTSDRVLLLWLAASPGPYASGAALGRAAQLRRWVAYRALRRLRQGGLVTPDRPFSLTTAGQQAVEGVAR